MRTADESRDTFASSLLVALRDGDEAATELLVLKLAEDGQLQSRLLGELMPELAKIKTSVMENGLGTRAVNALARAGVTSFAELAAQSPASLLTLPNLGLGSLVEILSSAVREWAGAILDLPKKTGSGRPSSTAARPVECDRDLAGAFEALEDATPDFDLFRRHTLAAEHPSLRQLGAELGITGERIRQRENRAREAISAQLQVEGSPVQRAVCRLRDRLGSLARADELDGAIAELDLDGRAFESAPHRRALLLFLTGYKISEEWATSAGLDRQTDKVLSAATERGPIGLDDCCRELSCLGVREELRRPWLESRPGFRVIGGQVARESQVMEVPLEILRTAGEPLDLHDLFERAERPMCFESFRSRIHQDERFMRRGVRHYGLTEWREDPYTTLAEAMLGEIERNGGGMELDALVVVMTKRFDVAEGSVLHRARAPQFEVDSSGRISRCIAPVVVPPTLLALTRNCFHLEAGWAMKVNVTRSLMRGATTRMPLAFARVLGLQLGTSQAVTIPGGTLRVYWPRYAASAAHLSSLKAVAERMGAHEGDRLFVIHSGEDRIDFKLVGKQQCEVATGMEHLALECGCEPRMEPSRQILAALGLDPGLANAEELIRTRLAERHEQRLAEWMDTDD